jgi:hypothetical protein
MSKDFVEIQPVTQSGEVFSPAYGPEARASTHVDVQGPGKLDVRDNPGFVDGAYANLRHAAARKAIEAAGFPFSVGATYRIPVEAAESRFPAFVTTSEDMGKPEYGALVPMSDAVRRAIAAARRAGASHIEIAIS